MQDAKEEVQDLQNQLAETRGELEKKVISPLQLPAVRRLRAVDLLSGCTALHNQGTHADDLWPHGSSGIHCVQEFLLAQISAAANAAGGTPGNRSVDWQCCWHAHWIHASHAHGVHKTHMICGLTGLCWERTGQRSGPVRPARDRSRRLQHTTMRRTMLTMTSQSTR